MRPLILFAALLRLQGFLAEEGACPSLEGSPDVEGGGQVLSVSISSHGRPTSLFLSWAAAEPGGLNHALRLTRLGSPEGQQQLQALTNESSFEFHGLVPGTHYQLEVTVLRPCGQNDTISLTARTAPSVVRGLQLHSSGSPASLEASWSDAPGEQDSYQLLLYHLESQALVYNISVSPGNLSYNFGGLLPGSQYILEVITWAGNLHAKTSIHQWTDPVPPDHLRLRALNTSSLQASWSSSEGSTWLYLVLTDLLGGTNLTAEVRRGVSSHVFVHLSPGTPYELMLTAAAGPRQVVGPNATEWTYPAAPSDLLLAPLPPELWASWKTGPGSRDGYVLRLSGPVEKNTTLGPEECNAVFPGPLPVGHYAVELKVLAGPYTAWTSASAWLDGSAAWPRQVPGARLWLNGVEASKQPGRQALLYADGAPDLLGNISMPFGATHITFCGLVPGAHYRVVIVSSLGDITQRLTGHTSPLAPQSLQVISRSSPTNLTVGWTRAPGQQEGYKVTWHQDGTQRSPGSLVDLGPDSSSLTLKGLVPGSCYTISAWAWSGNLSSNPRKIHSCTPPLAPTLVNVISEAPTQLRASWAHASGGRSSYQVTLYQAGARKATSTTGPKMDNTSFSALTPGTKYEVEVISWAGSLHTAAANVSAWTSPLTPNELLVSMQAGSAVVNLAWPSGPLGQGTCHARLSDTGRLSWEQPLMLGQAHFVLRDLTPGCTFLLSVQCQAGPLQAFTHPVVLSVEPGPVEDVLCQPEATHLALNWTMPAGDVSTCLVVAEQLVVGGNALLVFRANTSEDTLLLHNLMPTTSYRLSLTALGRNSLWSRAVTLVCTTSAAGSLAPPRLVEAPQLEMETGMGVTITRDMFGKDDGQIQWYGIIATTNMSLAQPSQEAANHTWYDHYYRGHDSYLAVLLPNPFYPGPWAVPRSWTVPVGIEDCGHTQEICNGHLRPGSQYRFSVAAFTRLGLPETTISFSAFSEPRASVSAVAVPLPVMVGTVAGCILIVCTVLGLLCWRRLKGPRAEKDGFSHELMPYSLRRTHRPIPIHSFRQSYEAKSAHAHQAFFQEFEELKEVGREQPRLEAEHPANITKNRYPHVLPYDHSRVRLTQLVGEPHSDYINANFIPGYTHPQEFIATQGPLKKTLKDFWRLVWEQQVHVIIMLTVGMENGRVLCEHYWPADSTPVTHGHFTIHLLAEEPEDEWTKREFQLQHGAQQKHRQVKQLQFTTWPDHGVPESPSSLLTFVELVWEQVRATQGKGPILVHCSAGVGRTGTFVALLRLLQQLEEEQVVDVFNAVYTLRLHRPLMIQTPSQYIFLHNCLLKKILEVSSDHSNSGPISVMNFAQACAKRAANANAGFLKEYKLLKQAIKDEAGTSMSPPSYKQNSTVFYDHYQPQFTLVKESPAENVLEAWLFPGGPSGRDHVVLTGSAGPKELWELVWMHGAHVMVSLGLPDAKEKPQNFWPMEMQPIITDLVTVHKVAESNAAGWPCTLFRVIHGESGMERQVQRLQFPCWESGCELPAATLLPFLEAVSQCCSQGKSKKPGTLLSHSSKSTNQLGTFLAMEQLLQQAGTECTVDVFNVALKQSQACGLMTPTMEQYIYLYNCLNSALLNRLP